MAKLPDPFKIRKLDKRGTLTVVVTREFKIRAFIALRLIKLGCWIIGLGYKTEEADDATH